MTERFGFMDYFTALNDERACFYVSFFTPRDDGKCRFSYNNDTIKKQK
jgi:hypothetical protein